MAKLKKPTPEQMYWHVHEALEGMDLLLTKMPICEHLGPDWKVMQEWAAGAPKAIKCLESGKFLEALHYTTLAAVVGMTYLIQFGHQYDALAQPFVSLAQPLIDKELKRRNGKVVKQAVEYARAKEKLAQLLNDRPDRYTANVKEAYGRREIVNGTAKIRGPRAFHNHLKSIGVTGNGWKRAIAAGDTARFIAKLGPDSKDPS